MSILNSQGFGKGVIVRNVSGIGNNNIPLLSSFYFRFQKPGSTDAVDNHINSIIVLPGGTSQDLSPNADLSPSAELPGTIALMMADRNPNDSASDNYFYHITYSTIPVTQAKRFQFRDVGCVGRCRQVLPPPPGQPHPAQDSIFVLVGFKLFFTGGRDRHIDKISVLEDNGTLTIEFQDRSVGNSDVYGYLIDYAWVSPQGQNINLGEETGTARAGSRIPLTGQKVIRGFSFDFVSSDHHLREIGVMSVNDNLEVYYSDWNGDDLFRWKVRWATISPLVIGQ